VVPVHLDSSQQSPASTGGSVGLKPGDEIKNPLTNKSVGRLLAVQGGLGLAMVRLQEAFAAESLVCENRPLRVDKPVWWPPEKKKDQGANKAQE